MKNKHKCKKRTVAVSLQPIDQNIRGVNIASLSASQILLQNPIIYDAFNTKKMYLSRLKAYLAIVSGKESIYENAAISFYEHILAAECDDFQEEHSIGWYKIFIVCDLVHILGYSTSAITEKNLDECAIAYARDFANGDDFDDCKNGFKRVMRSVNCLTTAQLSKLARNGVDEAGYIMLMKKNFKFIRRAPFSILVTANMSAGKSTFINALAGYRVSLDKTMACTGKIHTVVNKCFEDGLAYEYDHDLSLSAGSDRLLNDNEDNPTDEIVAAAYFNGILSGKRIIISDTPGVNFSGEVHHKELTEKEIKKNNYHLLVYIMNATQLATDDENAHLEFIKNNVKNTPVIFVLNKTDAFNDEEEDILGIIEGQREYLVQKGFNNPIVCPLSAKAAYLSKLFKKGELSRLQEHELSTLVSKFEKIDFPGYYKKRFPSIKVSDFPSEEEQLIKICGFAYVEKIIAALAAGKQV